MNEHVQLREHPEHSEASSLREAFLESELSMLRSEHTLATNLIRSARADLRSCTLFDATNALLVDLRTAQEAREFLRHELEDKRTELTQALAAVARLSRALADHEAP